MSIREHLPKIVGISLFAVMVTGMVGYGVATMPASEPAAQSSSAVVSVDHGGLPHCTDAIADAHGMCWGEPTSEPNGLADSTPAPYITALPVPVQTSVPAAAPAPAPVTQPAPPAVEVAPPVESTNDWRDGYVPCDTPSGNTMVVGCYVDGDQPYIVTDDGETFLIDPATGQRTYVEQGMEPWVEAPAWAHGLPPCATEDSDDCYWDAATRGNGVGFSFVNERGVTTYPQVLPDVSSLRICEVEDDDACYFPGIERGELANWVNAPDLQWTYFFDGVNEDLNGWVS